MIRIPRAPLNVAAASHPGTEGRQNEDRYSVSAYHLSETNHTSSVFAIVSDGIGGHRAGEVAAELAVESISHLVSQSDGSQPLEVLDWAIQSASESIAATAKDNTRHIGMGTTCACAWVIGNRLFTGSVGDSRIYLLRGDTILQLTIDHTWIQEAMEKGILKAEQVRNHPNQHVIRRYLGSSKAPQVDNRIRLAKDESDTQSRSHQGLRLVPGDVLLLCTDGLTDMASDHEILERVRSRGISGAALQSAAQGLVDLAVERNGPDNITAVLLAVPGTARRKKKKINPWVWALVGVAFVCLLAAVLAAGGWLAFGVLLPPSPTPTPFG
jgi:serine/threonine protein phosphatase PrpC